MQADASDHEALTGALEAARAGLGSLDAVVNAVTASRPPAGSPPGKGLWAAGAFATRALVQAAAQELRGEGIHVALLAVDATIESPKTIA